MKVLFICRGNICRSPIAHGLFLHLAEQHLADTVEVDSAGTHSSSGSQPDICSQEVASRHGVDISTLHSRQIVERDFDDYDYIIAMDKANLSYMLAQCSERNRHKLKLLLDYADNVDVAEVPDPYGQGVDGFQIVYELIRQGCLGLLCFLKKAHSK